MKLLNVNKSEIILEKVETILSLSFWVFICLALLAVNNKVYNLAYFFSGIFLFSFLLISFIWKWKNESPKPKSKVVRIPSVLLYFRKIFFLLFGG